MRRSRLPARVAVKGATLFALCAGAPVLIASGARADAGGHHRDETSAERRAGPDSGATVTLRVLPATTTPATEPPPGPAGPSSNEADIAGPAADAHSDGANGISGDLDGGHTTSSHNGNADASHGRHTGRHAAPGRGPATRAGATGRSRSAAPGRHPRRTAHGRRGPRGLLPFTGHDMRLAAMTGATTVLAGILLLWISSVRRRKKA